MRREITGAVLFVLIGFLALFAFFDFINEIDDVGRGGYKIQHAITYVLLTMPSHAYELMPIAALIGTIYALSQFASHSEFTAMRAAGLGRRNALSQITRIGLLFAAFTAGAGRGRDAAGRAAGAAGAAYGTGRRHGQPVPFRHVDQGHLARRGRQRVASTCASSTSATLLPDGTLRNVRVFEFDP